MIDNFPLETIIPVAITERVLYILYNSSRRAAKIGTWSTSYDRGGSMSGFGELTRAHRVRLQETLRAFCARTGLDPAYISKVERGMLSPPQDQAKLEAYARFLALEPGTEAWTTFMDAAAIASGRLPADIIADKELMDSMPAFLRTIRGEKITEDKLKELVDMIRGGRGA